uniref:Cecropin-P2 n=3 Tax=Ascaris TaxID=6251 RepID=CECP2_ASCSU|nr:RecName: Full=Cecropin-P2; Flags: Precursor [Ascaris suum]BAD89086.1 cecropin P2 [Ascaris suum]BAD89090.1 cecropin P2 [Ascaris suum]
MIFIYLLVQTAESSWLSKTYKKLENSAKKRISEGIAIAIQGGPRRRRFVVQQDTISPRLEVDERFLPNSVQEQI